MTGSVWDPDRAVRAAAEHLGLTAIGTPWPSSSVRRVVPATTSSGLSCVLKVARPGDPEVASEAAALRAWAGRGAVQLLAADADVGVLVLARAQPGTPASRRVPDEEESTTIACGDVLRELHRAPVPAAGLTDLATLGQVTDRVRLPSGCTLDASHVDRARSLCADLLVDQRVPVVLHGDLHHDNLLTDRGGWTAIDPKGMVGEPAADVVAWLRNPLDMVGGLAHQPKRLGALVDARLEVLVDRAHLDADRARAWGYVGSVWSALWDVEDAPDAPAVPSPATLGVIAHLASSA